ncbi:glutathione S-transferase N-terminal domain-containing protein [Billgrantia endophytica]|uniref:Glutathione S-transferase n=1 Tax=Billgrantia endophytica TaxID=2033802 RepID=A0A2N7TXR9_9GAMM|nr:glutathione S-transferase N-terminal domain-containing protein [Halomonas endophytica]PMR72980.1 glutathione S-transferase [Halomonas endophytica]
MRLYLSINSPYARKVRVAIHELGIAQRIEMVETDPRDPSTGFWDVNPLGKIPALSLAYGSTIYDSPVIGEYLNELVDGALLPKDASRRWRVRTLVALGDGILDAGMAVRLEDMRPENERSATWIAKQLATAQRGVDALERLLPEYDDRVDLGSICVACTLAWLMFRHEEQEWLSGRERLASWFQDFDRRESMRVTRPGLPLEVS